MIWANSIWWLFFLKKCFLLKHGIKPTIITYWIFLKYLKRRGTIYKAASIKFLYLKTIRTSNISWIWRAWALSKSLGLKNCQDTIFRLIIIKAKLIVLLISCHNIFSGVVRKKKLFVLKIPKCYINSNLCWHKQILELNILRLWIEVLSPLYQVFICGTTILPQLRQFWNTI